MRESQLEMSRDSWEKLAMKSLTGRFDVLPISVLRAVVSVSVFEMEPVQMVKCWFRTVL